MVGVGESAEYRDSPILVGTAEELATADYGGTATWLIGGGAVSWEQVKEVNRVGGLVLSRAVLLDPPPDSEIPAEIRSWSSGTDDAAIAVAVLVIVMALLEVVLLAGPAFAVGARRQSRSLALMAATGGTPVQARRVVLAGGVVLGGVGALLGVLLGIAAGWALMPVVQRFSGSWFGPFDVPWPHLAGIAAFGLLSALLAAVVPAWIASRQDVVAVLAGRRGDRAPGLRSPVVGAVLLGAGVAGAAYGALRPSSGEFFIAGAAIVSVLGMILLVPLVLVGLARLSKRLPLTVRYAVRDASRHRTRTVPAVAAVAATVAGVVALGIATSSDDAQNEAGYTQSLPMGQGSISAYGLDAGGWSRMTAAAQQAVPGARVTPVTGLVEGMPPSMPGAASYYLDFRKPGRSRDPVLSEYSSAPRFVGARRRRGAARGDPGDRRGGPGAGRRHARAGWGRRLHRPGRRGGRGADPRPARHRSPVTPARPGHRAGGFRPVHQRLPDGGRRAALEPGRASGGRERDRLPRHQRRRHLAAPGDRPVGGGRGDARATPGSTSSAATRPTTRR